MGILPVHVRDLVPLRRVKDSSPASASGLCSRASKGLSPLRRVKLASPVNVWELCSLHERDLVL